MLIHRAPQGSPGWHTARAGVITASMFSTARQRVNGLTDQQQTYVDAILRGLSENQAMTVAEYKSKPRAEGIALALRGEKVGEPSDAARDYAFRLAIERISGKPLDEGHETWQMRRGHEMEPAARAAHEAHAGVIVQMAGFVATDDRLFGASADGLIGADGGAEYKCLVSPERLRSTILLNDISPYMDQVQGGLWITGREWWDFCVFCPALASSGRELCRWRVYRDEEYIDAMVDELITFERMVSAFEAELRHPLPAPVLAAEMAEV